MSTELITQLHTAETTIMSAIENVQMLVALAAKEVERLTTEKARLEQSVEPIKESIVAFNAERNGLQADVHKAHEESRKARQAEATASQEFRAKLFADTDAYKVDCAGQVREANARKDTAMKEAGEAERLKAVAEKELEKFKASLFQA